MGNFLHSIVQSNLTGDYNGEVTDRRAMFHSVYLLEKINCTSQQGSILSKIPGNPDGLPG